MPSRFEKLQEELKKKNNARGSSPLELYFENNLKMCGIYEYEKEKQVGTFFIDFAFPTINLSVELDGSYHKSPDMKDKDRNKTIYLQSCGLEVYRIPSSEIWKTKLLAKHLKRIYEMLHPDRPLKYAIWELMDTLEGEPLNKSREPIMEYCPVHKVTEII